jgi:hypothetical protein
MTSPTIFVTPDPAHALTFDVVIRDARGESRHRVTIQADEAGRWAELGAEPSRCVEAAMRFLLDREPKESILSAFDMRVIRRYFPEFDDAFPDYLAGRGGGPGSNT